MTYRNQERSQSDVGKHGGMGLQNPLPSSIEDKRKNKWNMYENRVPLNPMVDDHYPYEQWLFRWEY